MVREWFFDGIVVNVDVVLVLFLGNNVEKIIVIYCVAGRKN